MVRRQPTTKPQPQNAEATRNIETVPSAYNDIAADAIGMALSAQLFLLCPDP
jgi:hypothetical protein